MLSSVSFGRSCGACQPRKPVAERFYVPKQQQQKEPQHTWRLAFPQDTLLAQVAGGGRSSARETIGRVAAGAVAKKLLKTVAGVEVRGAADALNPIVLLNLASPQIFMRK